MPTPVSIYIDATVVANGYEEAAVLLKPADFSTGAGVFAEVVSDGTCVFKANALALADVADFIAWLNANYT